MLPLPLFPMLLLPPLTCCCHSCCCCCRCCAVPAAAPAPALVFARSALFDRLCYLCSFGFVCARLSCRSPVPARLAFIRGCSCVSCLCALALCLFPAVRLYSLGCAASCLFVCVCVFVLVRARSSSFVWSGSGRERWECGRSSHIWFRHGVTLCFKNIMFCIYLYLQQILSNLLWFYWILWVFVSTFKYM